MSIVYSHSMQTCLVYGVGKAVDEACSRLNDLLSWQSITLPFDPSYVVWLCVRCHVGGSSDQPRSALPQAGERLPVYHSH